MSKPIRVLIADDHAIVRQGLRQVLDPARSLTRRNGHCASGSWPSWTSYVPLAMR